MLNLDQPPFTRLHDGPSIFKVHFHALATLHLPADLPIGHFILLSRPISLRATKVPVSSLHVVVLMESFLFDHESGIGDPGIERIAHWLTPLNFALAQKDYFSRRADGTGRWVLAHNSFQEWLHGSDKTLWCHGMRTSLGQSCYSFMNDFDFVVAGVGKTILAYVAII